ncbi:spermidine synthase [Chloroflexota bacterium]
MKFKFTNLGIGIALALSAAAALIYEVVAANVLFFYFAESSYSVATVLGVFLFGLGLGSLIIYLLLHKINNRKLLFGILQILIALYAFLVLTNLTEIVPKISTLGTFATSFAILLVPTIFLGAMFPLAGAIFEKTDRDIIGLVYSSDLCGAIIGSLVAGFILIPQYGAKIAVIVGVGINILSALIMLSRRMKIVPVIFLYLFFVASVYSPGFVYAEKSEYQFHSPSPYGEIIIMDDTLYIEGREQCSRSYLNWPREATERGMAVWALESLADSDDTLEVLNIGLGCGLTLEKALEYETKVDVVEINYQVVLANKTMTNVLTNPRVNLIVDDGLKHLRYSKKEYDSILIDVENPAVAHSLKLFTVEAFELVGDSLQGEGTFALWCFSYNSRFRDILYYSLKEAFPFVSYHDGDEVGVFVATKQDLGNPEYVPVGPYEINTIDKNTLTDAYLEGLKEYRSGADPS